MLKLNSKQDSSNCWAHSTQFSLSVLHTMVLIKKLPVVKPQVPVYGKSFLRKYESLAHKLKEISPRF